jgi:hypothetical protein
LSEIVISWLPDFVTKTIGDQTQDPAMRKTPAFYYFSKISDVAHPLLLDGLTLRALRGTGS